MGIEITKIDTRGGRRKFLEFAWSIYRDDKLWVPPIIGDQMKTVDPSRGLFFNRGEAELFLATRNGRPVGRICAAEDPPTNEKRGRSDCLFGFFECIDDADVAKALFDRVAEWASVRGLENLFGPFNLDYENSYGVLIEKRDRPAAILCGHSPTYYQRLFDEYGFEKARGDNLAFAASILPEENASLHRLGRLAEIARKRGNISVRGIDLSRFEEEVDCIHALMIPSLAHLPGSVPWRRDVLQRAMSPFLKFADPDLVLFAVVDGVNVGWFPGLPNLNETLIHCNGLRRPWNYLSLLRRARRQPESIAVKAVVVLPEYWKTGVAIMLFHEMAERGRAKGFRWVDLSLTAEDNPQTPLIAERLGATMYKRYRTYQKRLTG